MRRRSLWTRSRTSSPASRREQVRRSSPLAAERVGSSSCTATTLRGRTRARSSRSTPETRGVERCADVAVSGSAPSREQPTNRVPSIESVVLDIRLVRDDPGRIRSDLAKRNAPDKTKLLESMIEWDKRWRAALAEADALKRRRNEITREIAETKKAGKATEKLRKEAATLPKKIEVLDAKIDGLSTRVRDGLLRLPNILHESVPVGKDDTQNVEVARWGTPRS